VSRDDGSAIAESWYIPPRPEVPRGWLVYSLDYVLAMLQGCAAEPHLAKRTAGWLAVGGVVRVIMAVVQAIVMLLAWLPIVSTLTETTARVLTGNAAGFFLRACYWKAKLKHLGQNTLIDQYVDIRGPSAVSIGSHCHIDAYVRLKGGEQRYGQHGSIEIGNYVHLGPGSLVAGRGGVVIGDFVSMSADARLYSASNAIEHPDDPGQLISMSHVAPPDQQCAVEAPIVIEDYVFIGMMARVLPGVRVGRGAIIHADCELIRDVPPFANVGGVPRGKRIGWRRPRQRSPHLGPGKSADDRKHQP
jgi:acetyltransferase-like isoleucine patch superfamily enzyme